MGYPQFHPDIPFVPSPNFSSREGYVIDGLVIHNTAAGSAAGTIAWFEDAASKASAHFVLDRAGEFTQMVPLDKAAWHAGAAEMKYRGQFKRGPNRFTIGIEVCNHGLLYRDGNDKFFYEIAGTMKPYKQLIRPKEASLVVGGAEHKGWWEPFPDVQVDALMWLIQELQKHDDYRGAVSNLVGHEEIAVPIGRKIDPGPLFPWRRFGRQSGRATHSVLDGVEV